MATPIWPIEGVALNSTGDRVTGSLGAYVTSLYNSNYTEGRCYPTLAAGATIASPVAGTANWTLGGYGAVVPINTITTAYFVWAVIIETCNQDAVYELAIYNGAGHTLISTVRFSYLGGFFGNSVYRVPSVQLPANSQIDMKLASSNGFAFQATITASIVYRLFI
jgi:hypothetical protein